MQQKRRLYIDTGEKFITINTNIQKTQLRTILSDNFVPYIECFKKCGKSEICRFTDNLKRQNEDQKCGVIEGILENFLNSTFHIFKESDIEKKQRYLNATTKLIELVVDLEGALGVIFCKGMVEWFGDWSPSLFGGILRERRAMGDIAFLLKQIKDFRTEISVCLVEGRGDAELFRTFIRYVRASNYDKLKNLDLIHGKDNIRKNRVDLLVKNNIRRGERVILILDGDGDKIKTLNSLRKLWEQKLLRKKDIFIFKYNIELAFPPEMLFYALKEYRNFFKIKKTISKKEVLKSFIKKGDFVKYCSQKLGTNIDKVVFDRILGKLLAHVAYNYFREIMEKKPQFSKYEIFRFLEFIVKNY